MIAALALQSAGYAAETSARFNVTVQLRAAGGGISVANASTASAPTVGATGSRTISMPDALTIKPSGVAVRLRFRIIDPAVASATVLGLARPVRVTHGMADTWVRAPSREGKAHRLSLIVEYREAAVARRSTQPVEVTVVP